MDEEVFSSPPKNRKYSRRSSILKPPKARNPLSDLDFKKDDCSSSRSTRRVSFASNNTIKPFTIDEYKNTIWDSTYEEEVTPDVNHQSNNVDTAILKIQNNINKHFIPSNIIPNQNIEENPKTPKFLEESFFDLDILPSEDVKQKNIIEENVCKVNAIEVSSNNIMITQKEYQLFNLQTKKELLPKADLKDMQSQVLSSKKPVNFYSMNMPLIIENKSTNVNINQVSVVDTFKINKENVHPTFGTQQILIAPQKTVLKTVANSESFTRAENLQNCNYLKPSIPSVINNSTIFDQELFNVVNNSADLIDKSRSNLCETSAQIKSHAQLKNIYNETNTVCDEKNNETNTVCDEKNNVDVDMDMTQPLSVKIINENPDMSHNVSIHDNSNMDITEPLPYIKILVNTENNMKKHLCSSDNNTMYSSKIINKSHISIQNSSNMDITEPLPIIKISNNQKNTEKYICSTGNNGSKTIKSDRKTIYFDHIDAKSNMEITEGLPCMKIINKADRHINETKYCKADMEITEPISVMNIIDKNINLEVTTGLKIHNKDVNKERTICFDNADLEAAMEMTEALPSIQLIYKENIPETTKINSNMKFSDKMKDICCTYDTKKNIVNVNQENSDIDMEMTETIPVTKIIDCKHKFQQNPMISCFNEIDNKLEINEVVDKRKTVYFNYIDTKSNMEITETLPYVKILSNSSNTNYDVNNDSGKDNSRSESVNLKQTTSEFKVDNTVSIAEAAQDVINLSNLNVVEKMPDMSVKLLNKFDLINENLKLNNNKDQLDSDDHSENVSKHGSPILKRGSENLSLNKSEKKYNRSSGFDQSSGVMESTEILINAQISSCSFKTETREQKYANDELKNITSGPKNLEISASEMEICDLIYDNNRSLVKDNTNTSMAEKIEISNLDIEPKLTDYKHNISKQEINKSEIINDFKIPIQTSLKVSKKKTIFTAEEKSILFNNENSKTMSFGKLADSLIPPDIGSSILSPVKSLTEERKTPGKNIPKENSTKNEENSTHLSFGQLVDTIMPPDIRSAIVTPVKSLTEEMKTGKSVCKENSTKNENTTHLSFGQLADIIMPPDIGSVICTPIQSLKMDINTSTSKNISDKNAHQSITNKDISKALFFGQADTAIPFDVSPLKNISTNLTMATENILSEKSPLKSSCRLFKTVMEDENQTVEICEDNEDKTLEQFLNKDITENVSFCKLSKCVIPGGLSFLIDSSISSPNNNKCKNPENILNKVNEKLNSCEADLVISEIQSTAQNDEILLQASEELPNEKIVVMSNDAKKETNKESIKRVNDENHINSEDSIPNKLKCSKDISVENHDKSPVTHNQLQFNKFSSYIDNHNTLLELTTIDLITDESLENSNFMNVVAETERKIESTFLTQSDKNKQHTSDMEQEMEVIEISEESHSQSTMESIECKPCNEIKSNEIQCNPFLPEKVISPKKEGFTGIGLKDIEEKVNFKMASKNCKWKIGTIMEDKCWILTFFFNKLHLSIHLDTKRDTSKFQKVLHFSYNSTIKDTAPMDCHYVIHLFKKKFPVDLLKCICSDTRNIPTLLDSMSDQIIELMLTFRDFEYLYLRYPIKFNEKWKVKFSLASLPLRLVIDVTVDLDKDTDNIIVHPIIKPSTSVDIFEIARRIRSGPHWLKNLIIDIHDAIEMLEFQKNGRNI